MSKTCCTTVRRDQPCCFGQHRRGKTHAFCEHFGRSQNVHGVEKEVASLDGEATLQNVDSTFPYHEGIEIYRCGSRWQWRRAESSGAGGIINAHSHTSQKFEAKIGRILIILHSWWTKKVSWHRLTTVSTIRRPLGELAIEGRRKVTIDSKISTQE